jgi:hypothetical protein
VGIYNGNSGRAKNILLDREAGLGWTVNAIINAGISPSSCMECQETREDDLRKL